MKIEFIENEFDVLGRNKVFVFKLKENGLSQEIKEFKKILYIGKEVEINQKNWKIIGIESFKTMDGSMSNSVGLNVKENEK